MNLRFSTCSLVLCSILARSINQASAQIFVGGVSSDGSVLIVNSTLADDFFDSWSENTTGSYGINETVNFPAGGATIGIAETTLEFDSNLNLFTTTVDIFADAGIDPSGSDSESQTMVVNELFFNTTEDLDFFLTGNNDFAGGATSTYMFENTVTGQTFEFGDSGTLDAGNYVLRTSQIGGSTTLDGVFSGVQSVDFDFNLQLTAIPVPEPTTAAIPLLSGLYAATGTDG